MAYNNRYVASVLRPEQTRADCRVSQLRCRFPEDLPRAFLQPIYYYWQNVRNRPEYGVPGGRGMKY